MPLVMTKAGTVMCGHDPSSVTVQGNAKLTVQNSNALLKADVENGTVSVCATVASSDMTGPINVACTGVSSVATGEATKLTVGGKPVMLQTLTGATDGMVGKVTPQLLLHASAVQQKLTAV